MANLNGAAANIRGGMLKGLLLICLGSLGACASFDGQQRSVMPQLQIASAYVPATALVDYAGKADENARRRYRDIVIGIYMTTIDANFIAFKRNLSRESKGANFGLGSGFTALTTAATVAGQRTANILSAFASGLGGIQGRLSREVYFQMALPALLAGMEADRTRVRTDIVARMDEGDSYSLTAAFMDLARYEGAGSLDNAIETVTNQASELRQQEQARFENVIGLARIVPAPQRIELRTIGNRIDARDLDANRRAELTTIATELHIPALPANTLARRIMTKLRDMAANDPTSLSAFVTTMKNQGVDLTQ